MSSDELLPPAVRENPSMTTTAVYTVLALKGGAMSYDDLVAEIGASQRAIKDAVYDLQDAELVTSRPDPTNPHRRVHELNRSGGM